MNTHEQFADFENITGPTNRNFGLTMSFVFIFVAALSKYKFHSKIAFFAAVGISASFLIATFISPNKLSTINKYWAEFGKILQKIVTPLIMFVIYSTVFVPAGLLLKFTGKRTMLLYKDNTTSFWIKKTPAELPEPMKYQF